MKKLILFLLFSLVSFGFVFLHSMEGGMPYQENFDELTLVTDEELSQFAEELEEQFKGELLWENIKQLPVPVMVNIVDQKSDTFEKIACAAVIKEELAKRNISQNIGDTGKKNNRIYISKLNQQIKDIGASYIELTIKNLSSEKCTLVDQNKHLLHFVTPYKTKYTLRQIKESVNNYLNVVRIKTALAPIPSCEIAPQESKTIKILLPPRIFTNGRLCMYFKLISESRDEYPLIVSEDIKGHDLSMGILWDKKTWPLNSFSYPLHMNHDNTKVIDLDGEFTLNGVPPFRIIRYYKSEVVISRDHSSGKYYLTGCSAGVIEKLNVMEPLHSQKHILEEKKPTSYVDLTINNESDTSYVLIDEGLKNCPEGRRKLFECKKYTIPVGQCTVRIDLDNEYREIDRFVIKNLFLFRNCGEDLRMSIMLWDRRIPFDSSIILRINSSDCQKNVCTHNSANAGNRYEVKLNAAVRGYKASFTISNFPACPSHGFPKDAMIELVSEIPIEDEQLEENPTKKVRYSKEEGDME